MDRSYSVWIPWILRVLVAGVFLFSAFAKWLGPAGFEVYLVDQGLFGDRWTAGVFTRVLIGLECALGLAYLQPYYVRRVIAPVIVGVLVVFTAYLGYARFVLDVTGNCGCFGDVVAMGPLESMVKNVVTVALVAGTWPWLPARSRRWYVPAGLLVVSVGLAFFTLPMTAPGNTTFAQFTSFEGEGRVDLLQGTKMIVVADVECPHCRKATKKLGTLKRSGLELPDTYYLMYGTKQHEEVERFWEETGTRFPYRIISREVFMNLLKKQLPTVYLLRDGNIQQVWDENAVERIRNAFSG